MKNDMAWGPEAGVGVWNSVTPVFLSVLSEVSRIFFARVGYDNRPFCFHTTRLEVFVQFGIYHHGNWGYGPYAATMYDVGARLSMEPRSLYGSKMTTPRYVSQGSVILMGNGVALLRPPHQRILRVYRKCLPVVMSHSHVLYRFWNSHVSPLPDLLVRLPPQPASFIPLRPTPLGFCRQSQPLPYLNIPQGDSRISETVGLAAETTPDVVMHP